MIPEYMQVLWEHDVKNRGDREFVETLKNLPNEELYKIANGHTKEGYYDSDGDWLQKYKGSPLFQQAVELEKRLIELEAHEQEVRKLKEQEFSYVEAQDERDRIRLEKRILDLELASQQEGALNSAGEEDLEAAEGAGLEMAQQAHETEQAQKGKDISVSVADKKPEAKPVPQEGEKEAAIKVAHFTGLAKKMAMQDALVAKLANEYADMAEMAKEHDEAAAAEKANPTKTRLMHGLGGAGLGAIGGFGMSGLTGGNPLASAGLGALAGGTATALGVQPGRGHTDLANFYRGQTSPEAVQGQIASDLDSAEYADNNPGKIRATRALLGSAAGAGLGYAAGFGKRPGLGALIGGLGGAALAAAPKPSGQSFRDAAREGEEYLTNKQAAIGALGGMAAKAVGALKPFGSAVGAGAKNVGQAFRAGGLKSGLNEAKNVGGVIAKSHPLATAATAGAAGLGAGYMAGKS